MTTPTLFRSRLSIPVPDGWFPTEMVRLTGPAAQSIVSVEAQPVALGADLRPMADAHLVAMIGGATDATTSGIAEASAFDGRSVLVGRASAPTGDQSVILRTVYCIDGPWAYVVTGTALVAGDDAERAADDLEATVLAVRLPATPINPFTGDGDGAGASRPRPVLAARDWTAARGAWATPPSGTDGDAAVRVTYTVEQVAAAAHAQGATSAAGVDIAAVESLPPPLRGAVLTTSTRSLIAAGVMSGGVTNDDGGGGPRLLDAHGPLALAIAHDLLVIVERSEPSATTQRTFAARPDVAVEVAPLPGDGADTGMVEMATLPTGALLSRLLGAVGVATSTDAASPGGLDIEISDRDLRAAIANARAAVATETGATGPLELRSLRATVTVRIVARKGAGVTGSELRLLDTGPDGWLLIEPSSPSGGWGYARVRRRSAAELAETFLAHLPGTGLADDVTASRL